MKGISLILISLLLEVSLAFSQVIQTEASLDRNKCLIGDQLKLKLTLSKPKDAKIFFPSLADSLSKSLEIISASGIDTIFKQNDQVKLQQTLTITSFDTGVVSVPPIAFLMPRDTITDTIFTNQLMLTVHALPVDTTKKTIYDIKPPLNEPFSWKEILNYILLGLIALLIIALGVYIYLRIKKHKPIIPRIEKPKEPAYVIAFRELDVLKEKKLCQKQLFKQYYSELTDIIRIYLDNQFEIPSLESVSSELIEYLKQRDFDEEQIRNMRSLFTTADFVKFAKAEPLPDENDWHWKNAYSFIEKTKPEVISVPTEVFEEEKKGGDHD